MTDEQLLKARKQIEDIRKLYQENKVGQKFSILLMGLFGTGKTSFIATGRKPILIDSFDPNGTVVLERTHKEDIEKGDILIRTWWNESARRPQQYKIWERQWEQDIKSGFLNLFGTYGIDSATTFIDALANEIGTREKSAKLPVGALAQSDYQPLYATLKDVIKLTSNQDVDFVLTAHLVDVQDELTGEIRSEIDTFRKLKSQIPLLFTEKYVISTQNTSKGLEYQLYTQDFRRFRASTQIGARVFERVEVPDLKYLRKKAGMSIEDKPSIM